MKGSPEVLGFWWRLLIDPPYEGPQNMAIDESLLESCSQGKDKEYFPTLRFYQWSQPTLSIGYNQNIRESIHLDFCHKKEIPIVRRVTGGKAVFHDKEMTYSVTASFSSSPFQFSVFKNYRMISEALTEGLRHLGLDVMIADEEAPIYNKYGSEACFAKLSKYEISCKGFKIVGSAQRRRKKAFIQHGSIPMDANRKLINRIIKSKGSQNGMDFITVHEALGRMVTFEELAQSIIVGFERRFGITLGKSTLTHQEKKLAKDIGAQHLSAL